MTQKKDKLHSTVFQSTGDPNSEEPALFPDKIGDICIDITNKRLYFAHGLGSGNWGTAGTTG
jgi:hypothetical protein